MNNADKNTAPRHPLEAYAESYESMARDSQNNGSEARVSATAVAHDIRGNMIPATFGIEQSRVDLASVLELLIQPMEGRDTKQPGYEHRKGWNAAVTQLMDLNRAAALPFTPLQVGKWMAHSVKLNSLAWDAASLLGMVSGEQKAVSLDVDDVFKAVFDLARGAQSAAPSCCEKAAPHIQLSAEVPPSPLFWYRPRSDGGHEGPIHDSSIEQVRKESGAWQPLFGGVVPNTWESLSFLRWGDKYHLIGDKYHLIGDTPPELEGLSFTEDQFKAFAQAALAASPAVSLSRVPLFYVNPKIIDPATGQLADHVRTSLTWADKPTAGWDMPVFGVPFADAYTGAREELMMWKRQAQKAEQELWLEKETTSRLVAELNATNGPAAMGEPALCKNCGNTGVDQGGLPACRDCKAPRFQTSEMILRDVCETDPANPNLKDTICISATDLKMILDQHTGQTPRHESPYDTGDADLDRLLECSEYLNKPGANHDDGMMWIDALDKMKARLAAPVVQDDLSNKAATGDALRWALQECGVCRDDRGALFGDVALGKLATIVARAWSAKGVPQVQAMDPVSGDLLPPMSAEVLIHLAREDKWVPHTVCGYYVWGAHSGDSWHQRVFVRVRDKQGYFNARILNEVRRPDGTHYVDKGPHFEHTEKTAAGKSVDSELLDWVQATQPRILRPVAGGITHGWIVAPHAGYQSKQHRSLRDAIIEARENANAATRPQSQGKQS